MEIKRIIDVSRKIYPGMTVWPGDGVPEIIKESLIKKGDICNLSTIRMGVHNGTHVDAPLHFIDGAEDAGRLDLSDYIGFVNVFELGTEKCIAADDLRNLQINKGDIVFFKTLNSLIPEDEVFRKDFIYFDKSAAELLIQKGIRTIGVDYFSVDGFGPGDYSAHKLLLSHKIGIIEGLFLKEVKEGRYFFSCLPLRIEGVDGSPARAVLLEV